MVQLGNQAGLKTNVSEDVLGLALLLLLRAPVITTTSFY